MRVHVVYAHPSPSSFVAAVHREILLGLAEAGQEVDDLDLYAESFDPVLSPETFAVYVRTPDNRCGVERYVERLMRADALVFVTPVWFDGTPAILQGYFQRVYLPGVATTIDAKGLFHPNLVHIRRLITVCIYGEDSAAVAAKGDPPNRFFRDNIGVLVSPQGKFNALPHYDMNFTRADRRARYLARIRRAFAAL